MAQNDIYRTLAVAPHRKGAGAYELMLQHGAYTFFFSFGSEAQYWRSFRLVDAMTILFWMRNHIHRFLWHVTTLRAGSWGRHGAHLGPTGPRWAPSWPHELCYLGAHSYHNLNDGQVKPVLPLRHGIVITSHGILWMQSILHVPNWVNKVDTSLVNSV